MSKRKPESVASGQMDLFGKSKQFDFSDSKSNLYTKSKSSSASTKSSSSNNRNHTQSKSKAQPVSSSSDFMSSFVSRMSSLSSAKHINHVSCGMYAGMKLDLSGAGFFVSHSLTNVEGLPDYKARARFNRIFKVKNAPTNIKGVKSSLSASASSVASAKSSSASLSVSESADNSLMASASTAFRESNNESLPSVPNNNDNSESVPNNNDNSDSQDDDEDLTLSKFKLPITKNHGLTKDVLNDLVRTFFLISDKDKSNYYNPRLNLKPLHLSPIDKSKVKSALLNEWHNRISRRQKQQKKYRWNTKSEEYAIRATVHDFSSMNQALQIETRQIGLDNLTVATLSWIVHQFLHSIIVEYHGNDTSCLWIYYNGKWTMDYESAINDVVTRSAPGLTSSKFEYGQILSRLRAYSRHYSDDEIESKNTFITNTKSGFFNINTKQFHLHSPFVFNKRQLDTAYPTNKALDWIKKIPIRQIMGCFIHGNCTNSMRYYYYDVAHGYCDSMDVRGASDSILDETIPEFVSNFFHKISCGERGTKLQQMEECADAFEPNVSHGSGVNNIGGTHVGKTTLTMMISKVVGQGQISNVAINDMDDRDNLTAINQAIANISDDYNDNSNGKQAQLINDRNFKMIVRGQYVTVDNKFKDPRSVKITDATIQNINKMINVPSGIVGEWLVNRMTFIPFKHNFDKDKAKMSIKFRSEFLGTTPFRQYFLWLILNFTPRFTSYHQTPESKQLRYDFKYQNNKMLLFLKKIKNIKINRIPIITLYDLYNKTIYPGHNYKNVDKQAFKKELESALTTISYSISRQRYSVSQLNNLELIAKFLHEKIADYKPIKDKKGNIKDFEPKTVYIHMPKAKSRVYKSIVFTDVNSDVTDYDVGGIFYSITSDDAVKVPDIKFPLKFNKDIDQLNFEVNAFNDKFCKNGGQLSRLSTIFIERLVKYYSKLRKDKVDNIDNALIIKFGLKNRMELLKVTNFLFKAHSIYVSGSKSEAKSVMDKLSKDKKHTKLDEKMLRRQAKKYQNDELLAEANRTGDYSQVPNSAYNEEYLGMNIHLNNHLYCGKYSDSKRHYYYYLDSNGYAWCFSARGSYEAQTILEVNNKKHHVKVDYHVVISEVKFYNKNDVVATSHYGIKHMPLSNMIQLIFTNRTKDEMNNVATDNIVKSISKAHLYQYIHCLKTSKPIKQVKDDSKGKTGLPGISSVLAKDKIKAKISKLKKSNPKSSDCPNNYDDLYITIDGVHCSCLDNDKPYNDVNKPYYYCFDKDNEAWTIDKKYIDTNIDSDRDLKLATVIIDSIHYHGTRLITANADYFCPPSHKGKHIKIRFTGRKNIKNWNHNKSMYKMVSKKRLYEKIKSCKLEGLEMRSGPLDITSPTKPF